MWTIVVFVKENTIECVPTIWLDNNNNKCVWPQYKASKLATAIAVCEEPKQDWNVFDIRRLNGGKVYNDLVKARANCERGMYTSDFSEAEGSKRKSKKKFISSSEEELELESSDDYGLPNFPKESFNNSCKNENKNQLVKSSKGHAVPKITNSRNDTENERSQSVNKEFEYQVLRKLNTLVLKIDNLAEDVQTITKTLNSQRERSVDNMEDKDEYIFPLNTEEELNNFEAHLENRKNFLDFVKYIEKVGGHTAYDNVKRAYTRIMSNELACGYNWTGSKNKKHFGNLKLTKATIEAVLNNKLLQQTTEKQVEVAIKNWLRHARERSERKNKDGKENGNN